MEDRKLKVLAAVVDEYIRTGEPVGSKVVSTRPDIKVSAATIRNDMATLEEMGYLEQPHTSAGRVPTFAGYRLYIDCLMTTQSLSEEEKSMLDGMLDLSTPTEEALLQSASRALAELTQCAAVVANISPQYSVITKVDVIPTGRRLYVLLLITSSGNIKNKVCRLEFDLNKDQLEFFTSYMQENLQGVHLDELDDGRMEDLAVAMSTYMMTLAPLLQAVCDLSKDLQKQEIVVSGEGNLLAQEGMDQGQIIRFLEHKDQLARLLDDTFDQLTVRFGEEGDGFVIGNSSMIVSKVQKGGRSAGALSVIGPMRLDYAKVIPYIEYFSRRISDILSDELEDNNYNEEGGITHE